MVNTATSQNGDKPKRLQVQSKRINLLSSTMDLFRVLLTKCQFIQLYAVLAVQSLVSILSQAQICLALMPGIARDGILYFFSCNSTVACHICVQPTVDYIDFTRTVGVVWVCRRFEYSVDPMNE